MAGLTIGWMIVGGGFVNVRMTKVLFWYANSTQKPTRFFLEIYWISTERPFWVLATCACVHTCTCVCCLSGTKCQSPSILEIRGGDWYKLLHTDLQTLQFLGPLFTCPQYLLIIKSEPLWNFARKTGSHFHCPLLGYGFLQSVKPSLYVIYFKKFVDVFALATLLPCHSVVLGGLL